MFHEVISIISLHGGVMRKYALIVLSILLFVSGCTASHHAIFLPEEGISDVKLAPRTLPAKISKESDQALKSKGYVCIGNASSSDETASCWEGNCKDFSCSDKVSSRDMTKDILEAAASGGGDLVVMQQERAVYSKSTTRRGECLGSTPSQVTEQQCSGGYGNVARVCNNVTRTIYTCNSWATANGKACVTTSSGTVWRLEPGLESLIAKKQMEIEKDRPKKEKIAAYQRYVMSESDEKDDIKSVWVQGKYGFKDKNGKMVIDLQFTGKKYGFSEDVAVVAVGGDSDRKWGIINKSGNWVLPPTYSSMERASDGMIAFYDVIRTKSLCGYLNTKGKIIIAPQFSTCGYFSEGLAAVKYDNLGKTAYINKQGKMVIQTQFDEGQPFSEGRAVVKKGNKYGYIDKRGKIVIEPQFTDALKFVYGIASVTTDRKGMYIEKNGEIYKVSSEW
jgi:hypothetical protein